jgi:hypothetical protein
MIRLCLNNRWAGRLPGRKAVEAIENDSAGRSGRGARRPWRKAMLTLAASVTMLAGMAAAPTPADAFTWSAHGSYGQVGVPVARVGWVPNGIGFEQIQVPGRIVKESPLYANRDQWVCIKHRTWELSYGNWSLKDKTTNCGWIYANQTYINDPGYNSPYNPIAGTNLGYDVVVTWQLSSGLQVADMTIDYQVGNGYNLDLQCANYSSVYCSPVSNYGAVAIYMPYSIHP